jgi:hypothetical protein
MLLKVPARLNDKERLTVVVTGGRDFADEHFLDEALDRICDLCEEAGLRLVIVQGVWPTGADRFARAWAWHRNVQLVTELGRTDWTDRDRVSGPCRNQRMLDDHHPDMCVAMPGGRGTADMVRRCQAAGVPIWRGD